MTQTDPNSFLMSTGIRSFKFDKHGDTAKGPIVSLDMQQQRDIKTNQPKTWDDGNPMMQLRVVLDTGLQEDEEDDGKRAIYVRGQMQQAVRDAIRSAKCSAIQVGGTLAVQYVADGTPSKAGFNPPKEYRAQYQPPAETTTAVSADDLL